MKKWIAIWLAAALVLCFAACQAQPVEPSATPTPSETISPVAEVTPTPTPTETVPPSPEPTYTGPWPKAFADIRSLDLFSYEEELTPEEWKALQGFFPVLNNEVPMLAAHMPAEGSVTPTEEAFFYDIFDVYATAREFSPTDQQQMMSFTLIPVTGEGLDLILAMNEPMGWYLLIHREGEQFYAVYMPIRWFMMLQTDGLYMGSGGAAVAYYHRLHFENGTFTEELLANTDWGPYFAIGGEEVTEAEFDAWREENLSGDAVWYPARTRVEPWEKAYLDILLHPEEHEEFYAVADEHDDSLWVYEWNTTVGEDDSYCFSLCDLDRDGIPELMLGIEKWSARPWIILNILRWNEETETVEDMDGPKTYGILSTLWFFENGYLGTADCVGRLYARYWDLDKDSNDCWYGYLRGGTEIYDSDDTPINGSEFYAMLGERTDIDDWQELTEETVRQAFSSPAREEADP